MLIVSGIGKSFPIITASPGWRLGRKSDAALSISPQALSTISRSLSFVRRWTINVPSWLNTPSVISRGLWVAIQILSPNLRPSLAISSKASSFAKVSSLPIVLPMKLWASSRKTTTGFFWKARWRDSLSNARPIQFAMISRALYSNGIPLRSIRKSLWFGSVDDENPLIFSIKEIFLDVGWKSVLNGGELIIVVILLIKERQLANDWPSWFPHLVVSLTGFLSIQSVASGKIHSCSIWKDKWFKLKLNVGSSRLYCLYKLLKSPLDWSVFTIYSYVYISLFILANFKLFSASRNLGPWTFPDGSNNARKSVSKKHSGGR